MPASPCLRKGPPAPPPSVGALLAAARRSLCTWIQTLHLYPGACRGRYLLWPGRPGSSRTAPAIAYAAALTRARRCDSLVIRRFAAPAVVLRASAAACPRLMLKV